MAAVFHVLAQIFDQCHGAIDRQQEAIGFAVTELDKAGAVDRLERPLRLRRIGRGRHRPRLAVEIREISLLPDIPDAHEGRARHGFEGPFRAVPFRLHGHDGERAGSFAIEDPGFVEAHHQPIGAVELELLDRRSLRDRIDRRIDQGYGIDRTSRRLAGNRLGLGLHDLGSGLNHDRRGDNLRRSLRDRLLATGRRRHDVCGGFADIDRLRLGGRHETVETLLRVVGNDPRMA